MRNENNSLVYAVLCTRIYREPRGFRGVFFKFGIEEIGVLNNGRVGISVLLIWIIFGITRLTNCRLSSSIKMAS